MSARSGFLAALFVPLALWAVPPPGLSAKARLAVQTTAPDQARPKLAILPFASPMLLQPPAASAAAMPTVVAVGSVGNVNQLGSTADPGKPAGVAVDDILLWALETDAADTLTVPTGWTSVTAAQAGTNSKLWLWWRRVDGSEGGSFSVSRVGDHIASQIIAIRGCVNTGNPWDAVAGDTGSGTSQSVPGLTTTVDNCLVLDFISAGTDTTTPQFSGWTNADLTSVTEQFDNAYNGSGGGCVACASGGKAVAGAVSATSVTLANSSSDGRIKIALKP